MQRYLLRLNGEISIKSRQVQQQFVSRLFQNILDCARHTGHSVAIEREWNRLIVEDRSVDSPFGPHLRRIFGISSISKILSHCPPIEETILQVGSEVFAPHISGRTFAIRARRSAKELPFTSQRIADSLGDTLRAAGGVVRLKDPDRTCGIEIRRKGAEFFLDVDPGPGGLPVGVSGRALCLLSGGFDSAVAAWHILRRGVALDFMFCNLGGSTHERTALQVAHRLASHWCHGESPTWHAVDLRPLVADMALKVPARFRQIVLKRIMLRLASIHCRGHSGLQAIVMGDSIGQVSSQTLSNLVCIDRASEYPVLRPLVGQDKNDIIATARRIGTFDLSEHVREYCALVPRLPATRSDPAEIADIEAALDPDLLAASHAEHTTVDLRRLSPVQLRLPYIFVDHPPPGADLLDCRSPIEQRLRPVQGARQVSPEALMAGFPELERSRTYVLFCDHGQQSAALAEVMQDQGFDAYSLRTQPR